MGRSRLTKVKDGATAVVESQGADNRNRTATLVWVERGVTIALHLAVVAALILIGTRHFRDPTTGVGMACLYLMLPYTAYHVAQVHHVWPAAFVLWAVAMYRRPATAGAMLGVAAGTAFFPFLLFPLWFGFYRGRGATRFTLGFVMASGLSLALTAGLLLSERRPSRTFATLRCRSPTGSLGDRRTPRGYGRDRIGRTVCPYSSATWHLSL